MILAVSPDRSVVPICERTNNRQLLSCRRYLVDDGKMTARAFQASGADIDAALGQSGLPGGKGTAILSPLADLSESRFALSL
jgi:hypothetical protein